MDARAQALTGVQTVQRWMDTALDFMVKDGRNSEWFTIGIKVSMAWAYSHPGETMALKIYERSADLGLTDGRLVFILSFVAGFHIVGLIRNGGWKKSPVWRGACCFAGMIIFAVMAYITWTSSMVTAGVLPWVFTWLVYLEMTGCRRAGDDRRCLMQQ